MPAEGRGSADSKLPEEVLALAALQAEPPEVRPGLWVREGPHPQNPHLAGWGPTQHQPFPLRPSPLQRSGRWATFCPRRVVLRDSGQPAPVQ